MEKIIFFYYSFFKSIGLSDGPRMSCGFSMGSCAVTAAVHGNKPIGQFLQNFNGLVV